MRNQQLERYILPPMPDATVLPFWPQSAHVEFPSLFLSSRTALLVGDSMLLCDIPKVKCCGDDERYIELKIHG